MDPGMMARPAARLSLGFSTRDSDMVKIASCRGPRGPAVTVLAYVKRRPPYLVEEPRSLGRGETSRPLPHGVIVWTGYIIRTHGRAARGAFVPLTRQPPQGPRVYVAPSKFTERTSSRILPSLFFFQSLSVGQPEAGLCERPPASSFAPRRPAKADSQE